MTAAETKPAQCGNGRHVYDTDGKRIVGETCRCGARKLKKMT